MSHRLFVEGISLKTNQSELDGVPAVVKDHIFVKGLTSRNGLSFNNTISKLYHMVITLSTRAYLI